MKPDLHSAEFLRDPGPQLGSLRDRGGLIRLRLPLLGPVWATTNHADTHHVLGDSATFCRNPASFGGKPPEKVFWWVPGFVQPLLRNVTQMDGESHARLRRLAAPGFTTAAIDALRPRLGEITEDLLARLPRAGTADLMTNYSRRLPLMAICELLGIPEADRPRVIRLVEPVGGIVTLFDAFRAMPGLWLLSRHFRADFEAVRRAGGRPGLIGDLVQIHDTDADKLSDDELLAMVVALFVGGFDTTTHLIGNSILTLLQAPDLAADLRENPAGWPLFIEEVTRFHSPVMFTNMFHVSRDTELGGQPLRKGDRVVPLLIAANRDPEQTAAADRFDARRKPNRHLGFGYGTHVCMGMQLARAEAHLATRLLFERFPEIRLARPAGDLKMLRRIGLRGVAELPVILGPEATPA